MMNVDLDNSWEQNSTEQNLEMGMKYWVHVFEEAEARCLVYEQAETGFQGKMSIDYDQPIVGNIRCCAKIVKFEPADA